MKEDGREAMERKDFTAAADFSFSFSSTTSDWASRGFAATSRKDSSLHLPSPMYS